jgi:Fe-S cluster assembly ATP-binding protein
VKNYLEINDLRVENGGKEILKGLDLTVPQGEVHAIMGPNGSGKSTLANVIMGHPSYTVSSGTMRFDGKDLIELSTDERARLGLFLSFQYPVELPGISLTQLIKKSTSLFPGPAQGMNIRDLVSSLEKQGKVVGLPAEMLSRSTNDGFSGGEKKKAEILQMGMIQPKMIILDEIDSGLDIDALKGVASAINDLRNPDRSFLLITHYQRLLSLVWPDRVHVLGSGLITRSGGAELALELEEEGYVDKGRELEAAS